MIDFGYGISLRRIEEHQLDKLKEWRNKTVIRDYCRQVGLISDQDQLQWFKRQNEDKTMRMFMAGHVGVCGLTDINHISRRAEFSCYTGPEHQRQGFAEKALKTLFRFGFEELGLKTIWGETFENNPAIHLFTKIGMVKEGTRRNFYFKNGQFLDAHLLSITDTEFKALHCQ